MPNKRRGKWLPFDSLAGHRQNLKDAEEEIENEESPTLSSDAIEEINAFLIRASIEEIKVLIKIYKNGRRLSYEGYIKKIDSISKSLYLDNEKINMNSILNIKLL